MKTFALSLLFSAFVAAKDTNKSKDPVNDIQVPMNITIEVPTDAKESDEEYWQKYKSFNLYGRDIWNGFYQGLYGSMSDYEPNANCFGDWIVDKLMDLSAFKQELRKSWMVDMDRAAAASYDIVDLIFLNDRYCLFRKTIWDVKAFCAIEENCHSGDILEHIQENAFPLLTQVSSTVSAFKSQPWGEMDDKHKAMALGSIAKTVSGIFVDLVDFDASKIPASEIDIKAIH